MNVAGMPLAVNPSTWSFIRAINGDTTTVTPGSISAGSWKFRLLPEEVGAMQMVSRPEMADNMTSACFPRKD